MAGALEVAFRACCRWESEAVQLPGGPLLVAPNHLSVLDPFLVAFAVRRGGRTPRFVAREDLFAVPLLGAVLRAFDHLPLDRDRSSGAAQLERVAAALTAGECVVLYPEGRVTTAPGFALGRGLPGVAWLAARTRAPVVPVGQWGSQDLWHHGHASLLRWPPRRARATVRFGPPLALPTDASPRALATSTRTVMAAVAAQVVRARAALDPPHRPQEEPRAQL